MNEELVEVTVMCRPRDIEEIKLLAKEGWHKYVYGYDEPSEPVELTGVTLKWDGNPLRFEQ